jgi:uncharacterized membrane protein
MESMERETVEHLPSPRSRGDRSPTPRIHAGGAERAASLAAGAALIAFGTRRHGWSRGVAAGSGAFLLIRGATGRPVIRRLERRSALLRRTASMERSITIGVPAEQIAAALTPERVREILPFLQSCSANGDELAVAARIGGGRALEWRARFERQDSSLRWKSLPGAPFGHDLRIDLATAPGGRGTDVHARLELRPPAGAVGAAVARALRGIGARSVGAALARLKQSIEAGEIAKTDRQPQGARSRPKLLLDRIRGREHAR